MDVTLRTQFQRTVETIIREAFPMATITQPDRSSLVISFQDDTLYPEIANWLGHCIGAQLVHGADIIRP